MLDASTPDHHRQPFQKPCSGHDKRGQSQGVAQLKSRVAHDLERKVQAFGHLALVLSGLRT
jgi:hypothetical protein